ncbi:unnamed protein product, partial [Ixodes persulcatus]
VSSWILAWDSSSRSSKGLLGSMARTLILASETSSWSHQRSSAFSIVRNVLRLARMWSPGTRVQMESSSLIRQGRSPSTGVNHESVPTSWTWTFRWVWLRSTRTWFREVTSAPT